MFLRNLSKLYSRQFAAKATNQFHHIQRSQVQLLANHLCHPFSTLRVYDDDEDDSFPRRRQQTTSGTGNNYQNRFNASNRNQNFRFPSQSQFQQQQSRPLDVPDWKSVELTPIKKDFYIPNASASQRTKDEIDAFRLEHKITVADAGVPNAMLSFDDVTLPDYVSNELKKRNFTTPTPIQAQGWPIALSGHNLVGVAQTGSGKTLGYTVPAIVHINNQPRLKQGDGPIALVLAPTRELAQQIQQVANAYGSGSYVRNTCVFGGAGNYCSSYLHSFIAFPSNKV